jgi:alpha-tubulin suppressor-like RCC1 family protein
MLNRLIDFTFRLGLGHTENKNLPCLIEGIRDKKVVKMKSGFYHSVLLTEDKELYVFGRNAWVCILLLCYNT